MQRTPAQLEMYAPELTMPSTNSDFPVEKFTHFVKCMCTAFGVIQPFAAEMTNNVDFI